MNIIKIFLNEKFYRLIVVLSAVFFIIHYSSKKSIILILHSYNTDYSWVRDINKGIERVLEKQKSYIVVKYHYMDSKNHPNKEDILKSARITQEIISILKPSVIVAIDDDAQQYVVKNYINNPNIKFVFAGVNGQLAEYGYQNAQNITGYLERIPIDVIVDFLNYTKSKIAPNRNLKVVHVHDLSKTVEVDNQYLKNFKGWGNIELLPSLKALYFSEWKKNLEKAQTIADVILISNYRKILDDKTKKLISSEKVMEWTFNQSKKIILGLNGFVVEDGGAFAIGSSPFEQGEEAMEMALQLFSHKKTIKDLPIRETKQYIVSVHKERYANSYLKQGIELPKSYEALARAVGKYIIEKDK